MNPFHQSNQSLIATSIIYMVPFINIPYLLLNKLYQYYMQSMQKTQQFEPLTSTSLLERCVSISTDHIWPQNLTKGIEIRQFTDRFNCVKITENLI